MSDLHDRIAKALGWSARDAQSLSMQSLRDLVRPVDPALAREMDYAIQSGAYARGASRRPRGHAVRRSSAIDTAAHLKRAFSAKPRSALTLEEQARQARGAATRWERRASAHARAGEFREAEDAETEATDLGRLAARLHEEAASLRAHRGRSHAAKKSAKDVETAIRAAQLYIGSGQIVRMSDAQKLYRSMNRKIAAVAKRRGMDEADAHEQIVAEAKRRGAIAPVPGRDI